MKHKGLKRQGSLYVLAALCVLAAAGLVARYAWAQAVQACTEYTRAFGEDFDATTYKDEAATSAAHWMTPSGHPVPGPIILPALGSNFVVGAADCWAGGSTSARRATSTATAIRTSSASTSAGNTRLPSPVPSPSSGSSATSSRPMRAQRRSSASTSRPPTTSSTTTPARPPSPSGTTTATACSTSSSCATPRTSSATTTSRPRCTSTPAPPPCRPSASSISPRASRRPTSTASGRPTTSRRSTSTHTSRATPTSTSWPSAQDRIFVIANPGTAGFTVADWTISELSYDARTGFTGLPGGSCVAAADFDADGDVDVVGGTVGTTAYLVYYDNDGIGHFTRSEIAITDPTCVGSGRYRGRRLHRRRAARHVRVHGPGLPRRHDRGPHLVPAEPRRLGRPGRLAVPLPQRLHVADPLPLRHRHGHVARLRPGQRHRHRHRRRQPFRRLLLHRERAGRGLRALRPGPIDQHRRRLPRLPTSTPSPAFASARSIRAGRTAPTPAWPSRSSSPTTAAGPGRPTRPSPGPGSSTAPTCPGTISRTSAPTSAGGSS